MGITVWRGASWVWMVAALTGLVVWVTTALSSTWGNVAANWPSGDVTGDWALRAVTAGVLGLVVLGVGVVGVAAWIGMTRSGRFALLYGGLWGALLLILLAHAANRGIPGTPLRLLNVVAIHVIAISQVWVALRARRWSSQPRDETLAGPGPKAAGPQGSQHA